MKFQNTYLVNFLKSYLSNFFENSQVESYLK